MFTFLGQCELYTSDIGWPHSRTSLHVLLLGPEILGIMSVETTFGPHLSPLFAVNATRHCHSSAEWSNTTNYRDCLCNCTSGLEGTSSLEISIIIYLVGNYKLYRFRLFRWMIVTCKEGCQTEN